MVGGDPALEPVEPLPVAEDAKIGIGEIGRPLPGVGADTRALIGASRGAGRPTDIAPQPRRSPLG